MNSSTLRRLASDQASLRRTTPSNYLFPPTSDVSSLPDDLTQLTILITGAQGTAYSQGLWRLHLSMPDDYPKNPPKATFKTRIYHPNVDESSGTVCLDTLKKDWQSKLTLRDILITISCLLIHPNPDSALNSAAGALLQEDYEAFAKQARLMTSIHAPIPPGLREAVLEAKQRGEEHGSGQKYNVPESPTASGASSFVKSVATKYQGMSNAQQASQGSDNTASSASSFANLIQDYEEDDDAKENDPFHSPLPVLFSHESSRKHVLGKRPLSELPTPIDPDDTYSNITEPEQKAPYGQLPNTDDVPSEPVKKSSKIDVSAETFHTYHKSRQDGCPILQKNDHLLISQVTDSRDDKENMEDIQGWASNGVSKHVAQQPMSQAVEQPPRLTLRKVSNVGSSRLKGQARVGIRRL